MPQNIALSLETAQKLAVIKQGLHQRPSTADRQTMLNVIRQIGMLQLDSVSVVARSHYLVMLSRVGLYDQAELDALLYPDRALFEQWTHCACLMPVEDFRYLAPVIHARRDVKWPWERPERFGGDPQKVMDDVLAEIRDQGPLSSKDFADPRPGRGTWWDHKPAKHALDYLYSRGHLMVDRRVNFQIRYDLSERVLPASAESPTTGIEDYHYWATKKSVGHFGVSTARQVRDYYRLKLADVRPVLQRLEADGDIVPVTVDGWDEVAFIDAADVPLIEAITNGKHQPQLTTFLSPFDSLTWDRDRLEALFNFKYKIEIYTPKAKRKYGYYVLPILHNGRYVGRLDPKADRKTGTMIIHAIYLEEGEVVSDELVNGIANALREFAEFHQCPHLTITMSDPPALRSALLKKLK